MTKYSDLAIAAAIVFAAYKWGNPLMRAGAVAVGASIVANQIPPVQKAMTTKLYDII